MLTMETVDFTLKMRFIVFDFFISEDKLFQVLPFHVHVDVDKARFEMTELKLFIVIMNKYAYLKQFEQLFERGSARERKSMLLQIFFEQALHHFII